jgi:hypothetical protein
VVLGAAGQRGLANSGEAGGALARGRGGGGTRGHQGLICTGFEGEGDRRWGARRSPAVAAAGAAGPARWGGSAEGRHVCGLWQVPRTVGEGWFGA